MMENTWFPGLGSSSPRQPVVTWLVTWSVVPALLLVIPLSGCNKKSGTAKQTARPNKSSSIEDLLPVPFPQRDTKTSFSSAEQRLDLVYLDFGDDAGFILRSPLNVLILADVDGDGQPTPQRDRVYGVDLDEKRLCVFSIESDAGTCGSDQAIASNARVAGKMSAAGSNRYEIALRIPKVELLGENMRGLIVLETFDPDTAWPRERFPGVKSAGSRNNPFEREFRLRAASGSLEDVPTSWPALSRPEPHPARSEEYQLWSRLKFKAEPNSIFFGEKSTLSWVLPEDTVTVDLQPDLGSVSSPQEVSPEHTQAYTLRVKQQNGEWEQESVTLRVRDVEIRAFSIEPARVRYGGTFSVSWDVLGATDVKIVVAGSPQGTSMELPRTGNVSNQSKLRMRATRSQFPSPAHYRYELTAEGPGGPKTARAELQVIE